MPLLEQNKPLSKCPITPGTPSFFSKQISTLIPRDKLNSALSHHTFIMPAVELYTLGTMLLLYYIPTE